MINERSALGNTIRGKLFHRSSHSPLRMRPSDSPCIFLRYPWLSFPMLRLLDLHPAPCDCPTLRLPPRCRLSLGELVCRKSTTSAPSQTLLLASFAGLPGVASARNSGGECSPSERAPLSSRACLAARGEPLASDAEKYEDESSRAVFCAARLLRRERRLSIRRRIPSWSLSLPLLRSGPAEMPPPPALESELRVLLELALAGLAAAGAVGTAW